MMYVPFDTYANVTIPNILKNHSCLVIKTKNNKSIDMKTGEK